MNLTFDPMTQNQYGSSSHHEQLTCEIWKWIGKNFSLYRAPQGFLDRVPKLTLTFDLMTQSQ